MNRQGWNEYISDIKGNLEYIEKELDTMRSDDSGDIRACWNEQITQELKIIIQRTAELL